MRRILLLALASSTLALVAPGLASAAEHGRRHHHHHAHHRRVEHARVVLIGAPAAQLMPASPTTAPGMHAAGAAATVTSFANGRLTVTLADGTMLSGAVTDATEIGCESMGDHPEGDARESSGGGPGPSDEGRGGGEDNDENEERDDNDGAERCTAAALLPGAAVEGAELSIGSAGAVWRELELGDEGAV